MARATARRAHSATRLARRFRPFGADTRSEEAKAKGRVVEINNGRLAMIGLFGFVSEAMVPGSVPALTGLIKPYAGDVMAPFASNVFTLN